MDKLQQIISLLEKTIEQKRAYAYYLRTDTLVSMAAGRANDAMARYVDINIAELQRIVDDLKTVVL